MANAPKRLDKLAKSKNKKVASAAKNAIAARTIAGAGAHASGYQPPKPKEVGVTATSPGAGLMAPGNVQSTSAPTDGRANFYGKSWDAKSFGSLLSTAAKKGVSARDFVTNNPKLVARLGLSEKAVGNAVRAQESTSLAFRVARRARRRKG